MTTSNHLLSEIWEKYSDALMPEVYSSKATTITQALFLAKLISIGEFYYYLLDLRTGDLINPSENINALHYWNKPPKNIQDIINLIHPDDLEFVMEAEKWILSKLSQLDSNPTPCYKASYCFRMLNQNQEYNLFHHQAFQIIEPNSSKINKAINIHTNIQNITAINNYKITVSNTQDNQEFYTKTFNKTQEINKDFEKLTMREKEILRLLISGKTDKEIAVQLYISYYTARTHHKNILKKIPARNTTELTKLYIENGYL